MEKKQHDSWVTVRQESRKMADQKNEMQTLRNRLTLAETKLVEQEETNAGLRDTIEKIQRSSVANSVASKPDNNGSKSGIFSYLCNNLPAISRLFLRCP